MHSLSITRSAYQESKNEIDVKKALPFETLDFGKNNHHHQTNPNKEEDAELGYTSDCSTVALQSPGTEIKDLKTRDKLLGFPAQNVFSMEPGSGLNTTTMSKDGYLQNNCLDHGQYLQGNSRSDSDGYLQESNNSETVVPSTLTSLPQPERQGTAVFDGYIPDGLSVNQEDPSYLPSSSQVDCHESYCESAYVSGTSTSSGTNTGYIASTFSEMSDSLNHTHEIHHVFSDKANNGDSSQLSLCSDELDSYNSTDSKFVRTDVDRYNSQYDYNDSNNYLPNETVECDPVYIDETSCDNIDEHSKQPDNCPPSAYIPNTCDNEPDDVSNDLTPEKLEMCDNSIRSCYLPHNHLLSGSNNILPRNNQSEYVMTIDLPCTSFTTNSDSDTNYTLCDNTNESLCDQEKHGFEELEVDLCETTHSDTESNYTIATTHHIAFNQLHSPLKCLSQTHLTDDSDYLDNSVITLVGSDTSHTVSCFDASVEFDDVISTQPLPQEIELSIKPTIVSYSHSDNHKSDLFTLSLPSSQYTVSTQDALSTNKDGGYIDHTEYY